MASSSPKSVLIIGGGIVGLTCAVVLRDSGHKVTVIAAESSEHTASGVAAGMIAPALEAMNEADTAMAFQRLKAAQTVWRTLQAAWPQAARDAVVATLAQESDYIGSPEALERLAKTGAPLTPAGEGRMRVRGDGLVEAAATLNALQAHLLALGGEVICDRVERVSGDDVMLADGTRRNAEFVIIAAGYGARAFAGQVPSLACLTPIKGHLLDVPGVAGRGVLRAASGYWARYAESAKFGATMEAGRDDAGIDADIVADLKARAQALTPDVDLSKAQARVGVRAATPDGWPLIGRDAASGVLVATGMRRNGYVFAPLAAQILLDLIEGRATDRDYDPNRFAH
ncbi:MAG: NAD(P)/FAD-dependent oxidoreductase [Asticcacaulis sp.]|uniref:NAD(P)/FAD-dependent oxidoreductase n=1 Tax=Asticcacaulis sp. TaxID=1872648 RepID=UPI003F7C6570